MVPDRPFSSFASDGIHGEDMHDSASVLQALEDDRCKIDGQAVLCSVES